MGFSLSWIAVRGIPKETLLAPAGLRPTGKIGDYAVHGTTRALLPGGWTVVVAEGV
jgi:hypothetical protein